MNTPTDNQPKHTPGPLRAEKGVEDEPERWVVVADNGTRPYVIATTENGQPGDTLETEGYTAHLFAAAPDLLEVLKAIFKGWEHDQADPGSFILLEVSYANWKAARAAIAKAERREP